MHTPLHSNVYCRAVKLWRSSEESLDTHANARSFSSVSRARVFISEDERGDESCAAEQFSFFKLPSDAKKFRQLTSSKAFCRDSLDVSIGGFIDNNREGQELSAVAMRKKLNCQKLWVYVYARRDCPRDRIRFAVRAATSTFRICPTVLRLRNRPHQAAVWGI